MPKHNDRLFRDITEFLFLSDEPKLSDAIFLPGGSFPQPSERAAELWRAGFAPLLIPSGRYSITKGRFPGAAEKAGDYPGPYSTEAEFMSAVLQKSGVPQSAVLPEPEATFTKENACFSRQLTDARGLAIRRAILCCKSFHARRAWLYYRNAFPETEILVVAADVRNITRENWYQTEAGRKAVAGELVRIGQQFGDLLPAL